VLVWLCVWSQVQMICVWSSQCHATPIPSSLALLKSGMVLPFWYWLTQVVLEKRPFNGVVVVRCYKLRFPFTLSATALTVMLCVTICCLKLWCNCLSSTDIRAICTILFPVNQSRRTFNTLYLVLIAPMTQQNMATSLLAAKPDNVPCISVVFVVWMSRNTYEFLDICWAVVHKFYVKWTRVMYGYMLVSKCFQWTVLCIRGLIYKIFWFMVRLL